MAAKLRPWEIPSAVLVEPFGEGSWTSMKGLLSATGKLKRNALFVKYQEIISLRVAAIFEWLPSNAVGRGGV